jgi:hypothetical protein
VRRDRKVIRVANDITADHDAIARRARMPFSSETLFRHLLTF